MRGEKRSSMLGVLCGLLLAVLALPGSSRADMTTVNFESLAVDSVLSDQYAGLGVHFRSGLPLSAGPAAGTVTGSGYGSSSRAFQPDNYSTGFYLVFDDPIISFSAQIYEQVTEVPPAPEPEPSPVPSGETDPESSENPADAPPADESKPCVYVQLFGPSGNLLSEIGPVHSPNAWGELSFVSSDPVDVLWIYDNHYLFQIDDIQFESADPAPVPLPGSLLLVLTSVPVLAAAARRRIRALR
jgi:hypothetical protein